MTWNSDSDPMTDMQNAIKRLHKHQPNYKEMGSLEEQICSLTELLINLGKSPKEIEQLYVEYGIWPSILE